MTLLKPSLFINKLVVTKESRKVYSGSFHKGVNIISGQNGSGKSLLTELLFYALGGEVRSWKYPASVCDYVLAEVEINGALVTLKRPISESNPTTSMEIFFGPISEAMKSGLVGWNNYPYRSTENKESFSQILFSALGLPQMKGEQAVNVTINQIMRLIYADQLTPGGKIFKHQDKWDSAFLRESVGELLCGIYDEQLYEARLELVVKNRSLEAHINRLRTIFQILGASEQDVPVVDFEMAAKGIHQKLDDLHEKVSSLKQGAITLTPSSAKASDKLNEKSASRLSDLSNQARLLSEEIEQIALDIIDSKNFVQELKYRLSALDNAKKSSAYLGSIKFEICPCCMTPIKNPPIKAGAICNLCKEELTEDTHGINYLKMKNELTIQIRESERNIHAREAKKESLLVLRKSTIDERNAIYRALKGYTKTWATAQEQEIDETNIEIGRLNQELTNLREKEKLHNLLQKLKAERTLLNADVLRLKDIISARQQTQEGRREEVLNLVGAYIAKLLRKDLPREEKFISAQSVDIDFAANFLAVDKISVFSASSLVFLKNAFHFALLLASCKKEYMRYPRLAILDGIEDGGMEDIRSHKFQRLLVEYSSELDVDHQIIYTTAKIAPELRGSHLQVGPTYHKVERKTIALS